MGQYSLGRCYEFGLGIPSFEDMAFFWYERSANQGYNEAMYSLGCCYHKGYGCIKDESKAYYWFNKAYKSGLEKAKVELDKYKRNILGKYKRITND